jgi:tRNA 2-thiocytidine biosynthesis protein TtcA
MFRALSHVAPSHLADAELFDFAGLGSRGETARPDAHDWLGEKQGQGASSEGQ